MKRFAFFNWLRDKASLQIFAVLLALIAWFVVHSGQEVTQRLRLPVEIVNFSPNLIVTGGLPSHLSVQVSGTLSKIRSIAPAENPYRLDLSSATAGRQLVELDVSGFRLPVDLRLLSFQPRRVELQIEELDRKEVPVVLENLGQLNDSFVVRDIRLSPEFVQVVGPKPALEKITEVRLALDLEGRSESFSRALSVEWENPRVESIDQVFVEVDVSKQDVEKRFELVPVVPSPQQASVRIQPSQAAVRLKGVEQVLQEMEGNLRVEVPLENLEKGRYRIRGQVESSEDYEVLEITPESFIVEVLEGSAP